MERKIFAAVIAAVAALVIYNGGWEVIRVLGEIMFSMGWHSIAIIILSILTMALIIGTITIPIIIYQKITPKN